MGSLHSARIVQRHRRWAAAVVALSVAAGCNGDDEAGDTSEAPPIESTAPDTTEPPPETTDGDDDDRPPTTTSSTLAPTTTVSEEELKAQIAADYLRSWELRPRAHRESHPGWPRRQAGRDLGPGSENEATLRAFITELGLAR